MDKLCGLWGYVTGTRVPLHVARSLLFRYAKINCNTVTESSPVLHHLAASFRDKGHGSALWRRIVRRYARGRNNSLSRCGMSPVSRTSDSTARSYGENIPKIKVCPAECPLWIFFWVGRKELGTPAGASSRLVCHECRSKCSCVTKRADLRKSTRFVTLHTYLPWTKNTGPGAAEYAAIRAYGGLLLRKCFHVRHTARPDECLVLNKGKNLFREGEQIF